MIIIEQIENIAEQERQMSQNTPVLFFWDQV